MGIIFAIITAPLRFMKNRPEILTLKPTPWRSGNAGQQTFSLGTQCPCPVPV